MGEVLIQNGLQPDNPIWHVGEVPPYGIKPGMDGLCPLFSKKTKSNPPLSKEGDNVLFQHVEFGGYCGVWEGISIEGEEVVYSAL